MKTNAIVLTDQGICCIEAPVGFRPNCIYDCSGNDICECQNYDSAIEAAMKQAVLFKDQSQIKRLLSFNGISSLSDNELIPIPDGYEIKIETHSIYNGKDNPSIEYAILVPKKETENCQC